MTIGWSQSIDARVSYLVHFSKKMDSAALLNKYHGKKEYKMAKQVVNDIFKNTKDVEYTLEINGDLSRYFQSPSMEVENSSIINLAEIFGGSGEYYLDRNNELIIHETDLFGEKYLVEKPKIKWELSNESKIIGSYKAYKALTRRKVIKLIGAEIDKTIVAWYVPEIATSHGPKGYCGLPGLIVELNDGTLKISATKIDMYPLKEIKILKPKKGEQISFEEFENLTREFSKNLQQGKY